MLLSINNTKVNLGERNNSETKKQKKKRKLNKNQCCCFIYIFLILNSPAFVRALKRFLVIPFSVRIQISRFRVELRLRFQAFNFRIFLCKWPRLHNEQSQCVLYGVYELYHVRYGNSVGEFIITVTTTNVFVPFASFFFLSFSFSIGILVAIRWNLAQSSFFFFFGLK